ncbi:MAG: HAMP domain-containing protein [Clostridiaceae bacterium]|nr:HAMP domain-containing protein [Clostridiaceae bacterium]
MQKNFILRRILFLLLLAIVLWSILTSIVYLSIARPIFRNLKSESLYDQARIISYVASEGDKLITDDVIQLLALSIRFYESGVFITDETGMTLISNYPKDIPDYFLDGIDQEYDNFVNDVLSLQSRQSMIVFSEKLNKDLIFVGVPIIKTIEDKSYLMGSVVIVQTVDELQASYSSLNSALLISTIIVGLLVAIPIAFFASKVVQPLTKMREAVSAMVKGDFSQRLEPIEEDNEISYLINAFNHLASELDSNISKLTNERNQLQHIIDGIAEGIIAVNSEGKVTQNNDMVWHLFHQNTRIYTADELLKIIGLDELFEICLSEQRIVVEIKESGNDLINCLISPLLDQENVLYGAVGLFRDVTESEKLEETRREYVANVSHELRTPITAIRGLLEPLNDGLVKNEENRQKYYAILLRETKRLSDLIDDMLELSRIQTSEKIINLEPVYLKNDLLDLAVRFEVLADQKQITFEIQESQEQWSTVWGKADRIIQILSTIMENAVKFTPEGGKIVMSIAEDETGLTVSISDNGPGISLEDLPHVFERFYKADKAHNERGTGLGLSIAAELAEQMGHTLEVNSAEGKGSTFSLSMPFARDVMKSEPHLKDVYESDFDSEE